MKDICKALQGGCYVNYCFLDCSSAYRPQSSLRSSCAKCYVNPLQKVVPALKTSQSRLTRLGAKTWAQKIKWCALPKVSLPPFQFNLFTSLRRLCWAVELSMNISCTLLGSLSCNTMATRRDKVGTSFQPTGYHSCYFPIAQKTHLGTIFNQSEKLSLCMTLPVLFSGIQITSEKNRRLA